MVELGSNRGQGRTAVVKHGPNSAPPPPLHGSNSGTGATGAEDGGSGTGQRRAGRAGRCEDAWKTGRRRLKCWSMPGLSPVKTTGAGGGGRGPADRMVDRGPKRVKGLQEEAEVERGRMRSGEWSGTWCRRRQRKSSGRAGRGASCRASRASSWPPCQTRVKYWSNTGQVLVKVLVEIRQAGIQCWSNAARRRLAPPIRRPTGPNGPGPCQTWVKHWSNTGQIKAKGLNGSAAPRRGGGRGDSD